MPTRIYSKNRNDILHKRLLNLGEAITNGKIKTWDQVFAFVEPTPLAETLGIAFYSFQKKISATDEFKIGEVKALAKHTGIDPNAAFSFILSLKPKKS